VGFPATPPPLPGVVHIDVQVDRARWHVATAGAEGAPTVLLLHGWPQHWWMWRRVIAELAPTHRVLAPDLRGFGWSDAPPGRYSKMGLACDVERLLDELGIETCTLVGHDWGGFVAQLTAIRAPERVERVVALSIVHPWIGPMPLDPLALLRTTYQLPLATPWVGERVQRLGGRALRLLLERSAAPSFAWDREDLAHYAQAWERPDHARAASALYRTFLTRELPALLRGRYANRRLEMPLLLATGQLDPVVTPARIRGAEGHAAELRTEVLAGAGHFVVDEQPQRVLELLRDALGT
jgi:pimeloyl-ACP methyl ester carboxylesterase